MELDEMKLAWRALDQRLEQQHAMHVQIFRDLRTDAARRGLRPLMWGQALQMVVGALACSWSHRSGLRMCMSLRYLSRDWCCTLILSA